MKVVFIFIDGFGLGREEVQTNPLYSANIPNIRKMMAEYIVIPTDTTLGVEGLPQSATGQTAILTGINAPQVLGRHLHGQPTITLKKLLYKHSLFKILKEMNVKVTNANVYREQYLQQINNPKNRKLRPSASTVACMAAGITFRTVEDLKHGRGIYHDIINKILIESGYEVSLIEPESAAQILFNISQEYDFTFFEYFMTDIIGHKQEREKSEEVLEILDRFLGELDKIIDYTNTLLVITSDHGNIEDLSVKTHTFNKVPTIVHGKYAEIFVEGITSLVDISPAIIRVFSLALTDYERRIF
ncbi:MAG: 2,3-bisphosphoglycerate-independent phosphoglycerate mutase [Petroclostridium sp.]|jgi:predicted AlkP superfamily pyrophosphatase or phosphodiesterase|nr:metalloenzyme domain protein [Clostridia bacterium]MDK2810074.1 2,3-bisphosphoglycerate-independent phosphoglycerate mutase [Petroclostridium sp.]